MMSQNQTTASLPSNSSAFVSEDITFLEETIDELIDDLGVSDNMKERLARALFAVAIPGERDAAALRARLLESMLAPR
jgi:hypothetical protein